MNQNKDESGGEEDVDQFFLDDVLNKLYDFGDGMKDKTTKKAQKKRKRKIMCEEDVRDDTSADTLNASKDNERSSDKDPNNHKNSSLSNSPEVQNTTPAKKHPKVEIVIFQDPLKKSKKLSTTKKPVSEIKLPEIKGEKKGIQKEKKDPEEFNIEQARLDVHRFGITGYQKTQQRIFEQDRAIMLGARPPKKEHVNYKVFQQTIREKKQSEKEEAKSDTKKKKRKEGKPRDEKWKSSSRGEPAGQVGRFKHGMLVLSSKDIEKINSKKKK